MDPRVEKLAKNLVNYSMKVKPGENVLISYSGNDTISLALALIKEVYAAGGNPYTEICNSRITREILMNCNEEQLKLMADVDCKRMSQMQCYVSIRASENINELCDVPKDKMAIYNRLYTVPVHNEIRVPKTRWVVLRFPNGSMSQLANMSQEGFENFYYNVCNLDYSKMSNAMDNLVSLMNKTDKVRLVSPGTDLTFSIKDIPAIKCDGALNIPDGEVYTAPVKNSINGKISYNTPSIYQGTTFENVVLEFKDGKIINATSNHPEKINEIFDTDEGARYVGEFALGVNPYINKPMTDILFDEKISGSIHFTPGMCYDDASNGNDSSIHWDLVLIMTPEYGGGEIYFDDILIRKDGLFVIPELECLNPEHLM